MSEQLDVTSPDGETGKHSFAGRRVVQLTHSDGPAKFFAAAEPGPPPARPVRTFGRWYEESVAADLEEKAARAELLEAIVRRISADLTELAKLGMLTVEENAWRAEVERALGEEPSS